MITQKRIFDNKLYKLEGIADFIEYNIDSDSDYKSLCLAVENGISVQDFDKQYNKILNRMKSLIIKIF